MDESIYNIKSEVKSCLQKVYERYKDNGLVSVYLWGSIISDDFNPNTSDIDSVGFVEDNFPIEFENEIQNFLNNECSGMKKFGFRLLYINELNGAKIKSNLATYISPKLLLHDFPSWKFISGIKMSQKDFLLNAPTQDEAVKIELDVLEKKLTEREHENDIYIVKGIARLVDYAQGKRPNTAPFTYTNLKKEASGELETQVVDCLFECRKSRYDATTLQKNLPVFLKYMSHLKNT